jgi:hypothetical protein
MGNYRHFPQGTDRASTPSSIQAHLPSLSTSLSPCSSLTSDHATAPQASACQLLHTAIPVPVSSMALASRTTSNLSAGCRRPFQAARLRAVTGVYPATDGNAVLLIAHVLCSWHIIGISSSGTYSSLMCCLAVQASASNRDVFAATCAGVMAAITLATAPASMAGALRLPPLDNGEIDESVMLVLAAALPGQQGSKPQQKAIDVLTLLMCTSCAML